MSNSFLPEGYQTPQGGGGDYTRFAKGETLIRILSKPLMYWLEFVDKKPVRKPFEIHKPAPKPQGDQKVKQAWALIVYNYNTSKIEVCEITQVTIKLAIENYNKNAKWGNPFAYDLAINKTGEGLDTEYSVIANPKEPVSDVVKKAYKDTPINLQSLLTGDNPFIEGEATREYREETPVTETVKEVFKAEEVAKVDESQDLPF